MKTGSPIFKHTFISSGRHRLKHNSYESGKQRKISKSKVEKILWRSSYPAMELSREDLSWKKVKVVENRLRWWAGRSVWNSFDCKTDKTGNFYGYINESGPRRYEVLQKWSVCGEVHELHSKMLWRRKFDTARVCLGDDHNCIKYLRNKTIPMIRKGSRKCVPCHNLPIDMDFCGVRHATVFPTVAYLRPYLATLGCPLSQVHGRLIMNAPEHRFWH